MAKYDALAVFLSEVASDQSDVELTFGRIDGLVGGLPPSARQLRTWWANSSNVQSLAWRGSGWHVHAVDLAGSTVTFARGEVGGSDAVRGRNAPLPSGTTQRAGATPISNGSAEVLREKTETVDARVTFTWTRLGMVALDAAGELAFPGPLPAGPGLYRFTLLNPTGRGRVYIGESDNLRRRLSSNYRSPGPSQQTSLRVNALLIDHLRSSFEVMVEVSVEAALVVPGHPRTDLDLSRKAGRLLAESAALVVAQLSDDVDISNVG